jgi:16S rRNA processing protein RimM
MENFLEIGKIVNTRGIKGELKIIPLTDEPARFSKLKHLNIQLKDELVKKEIEYVKYYKNDIYVKLKEINDLDSAEKLKEHFILIERENAIKLPKGSYFICDLIGSEVFENDVKIGELVNIMPTGSNDVYIVRNENKKDILVPALKSVVKNISVENKRIDVEMPKGLEL